MRLDKYLADMGAGSRSDVKKLIRQGRVKVENEIVRDPGAGVEAGSRVALDGREIVYAEYEYIMLNKPAGVVSAVSDNLHKTVIDIVKDKKRKDLFPVGRLDIDTEGLLLVTNDGELAHRLLAPGRHVPKRYLARLDAELDDDARYALTHPMNIGSESEEEWVKPGKIVSERTITVRENGAGADNGPNGAGSDNGTDEAACEVILEITEGKFHQVKRMFAKTGRKVLYLKRLSMGSLKLDESLKPGESRRLTEEEINGLKREV